MECPTESQVVAFVGGAPFAQRDAVVDHVDECASCRALLAGLVRDDAVRVWRAGERVGRYVIGEPIGRGGMGSVWRAEDVELGRAVALKRLHVGGHDRLVREGRTLAQLQHPNVVAVYEVVDDEPPYLAMELVDGVTLTTWLKTARSWREIVAMVAQAGRGLAAAHARGLVHRDFKPDNVLVDHSAPPSGGAASPGQARLVDHSAPPSGGAASPGQARLVGHSAPPSGGTASGRARVVDFGLASATPEMFGDPLGEVAPGCKLARLTASMSGTPAYMAPELVDGAAPDARSDIYAFAVALFEALHGKHPFAGGTVETIWIEMAAGRIRDGGGDVPAWLDRAVRRGLAIDPRDRWPDIASFVAAIDRTPRRTYAAAAALGGFAVASAAAFMLLPGSQPDSCANGANRVDRVWNPIARIGLQASLRSAAETPTRLVDHWSDRWRADREAACSAGEHRVARISCLDHELDELRGQLAVWAAHPEAEHAIEAAMGLPAPSSCANASDTPIAARPIVLRIDEIKTLWRNGHSADAAPKLAPLLRDAEAIGHHDTLATALLAATLVETDLGDMTSVATHSARAATEASKAGDDATLYAALVQQAYARIDSGQPADALGICDAAEALAARGVPLPEKIVIARAGALIRLGRNPEAIAQYKRAIAMAEPNAPRDPVEHIALGTATGGLGNAYLAANDWEHAIEAHKKALALQEVDFGPHHPEVARTLHDLAVGESGARQLDAATADFARARSILVTAFGEHHPEVGELDVSMSGVAMHTHDYDKARALLLRANAELTGTLPPTHQIFAVIEGQLGQIEQNLDHCDAAIPHFEKSFANLVANHVGGTDIADVENEISLCLLDRDRFSDAKARADDSLEQLAKAEVTDDHTRLEPWFVLAMVAEARGDRATALRYARLVLEHTSPAPGAPHADMREALAAKHLTAS